jgi:hypothetical protein
MSDAMTLEEALRIAHDERKHGELLEKGNHLATRLAEVEADNAFARAEWAHWEAEACRIEKERDTLAGIVGPCAKFVAQALDDHTTARWWADADMQDHLKAHGFLAEERVTEEVIAKCGGSCECDVGYNCYRFTPLAQAVRDRALTPTREGA